MLPESKMVNAMAIKGEAAKEFRRRRADEGKRRFNMGFMDFWEVLRAGIDGNTVMLVVFDSFTLMQDE